MHQTSLKKNEKSRTQKTKTTLTKFPETSKMKPIKILPNLYLGNIHTAKSLPLLDSVGIKAILNIGAGVCQFPGRFAYWKVQMQDSDEECIEEHLEAAVGFLAGEIGKGPVLVHCQGGISRSPAFLVAYLAKCCGMTVLEAMAHVEKCRKGVRFRAKFIEGITRWLET
eukprot:TRINITY_DN4958_c0_g2_i1.p1 TRINITY_DN4958_c0_g2~~TRINITY_DN4958_c0_g2_i1.p1  ORF type:complete len:168 (-),score=10.08 TRINITY_DN4958_c0_g2_i1:121-624(-)